MKKWFLQSRGCEAAFRLTVAPPGFISFTLAGPSSTSFAVLMAAHSLALFADRPNRIRQGTLLHRHVAICTSRHPQALLFGTSKLSFLLSSHCMCACELSLASLVQSSLVAGLSPVEVSSPHSLFDVFYLLKVTCLLASLRPSTCPLLTTRVLVTATLHFVFGSK